MRAALSWVLFFGFLGSADAYTVKDARGTEFEFSEPPRVATVMPAVTESVFALGAGDLLLADSVFCSYPEEAKTKPKVGSFLNPDYEKIAELKPDVFILPTLSDDRIESRLKKLGIKCFFLNSEGLENISKDIILLGDLLRRRQEAARIARNIESATVKTQDGRRAMFMFGNMAAGKGSFIGGIMEVCGLKNCCDSIGKPWPVPSREFIIAANPQIVFVEYASESDKLYLEAFYKSDPVWSSTDAVKNDAVCFMPRNIVTIPSYRIMETISLMRDFCKKTK